MSFEFASLYRVPEYVRLWQYEKMNRVGKIWMLWVPGGVVGMLTLAGIYPTLQLARLVSSDGYLSPEYCELLQRSQLILTIALLVAPAIGLLGSRVLRYAWGLIRSMSPGAFSLAVGGGSFILTYLTQELLFAGIPHVTDAISHYFQGQIIAAGRFAAPLPQCFEHFSQHNIIMSTSGLWHTKYYPGHALWLASGFLLHAPSLIMPLAASVVAYTFYHLTRTFHSDESARLSALFLVVSPLWLLLNASYMSHTTFAAFFMLGVLLLNYGLGIPPIRARGVSWRGGGALIGSAFLLSMSILTRPQDAVPLFIIAAIVFHRRALSALRDHTMFVIVSMCLGASIPVGILLCWNYSLYGAVLVSGYNFSANSSLTPIIADSFGFDDVYTVQRALMLQLWSALRLNQAVVGWPIVWIIPVTFLRRRQNGKDWLCLLFMILSGAIYWPFHYYGFEFEARYYALPALFAIVLLARSLLRLHEVLVNCRFAVVARPLCHLFTPVLVLALSLHAILYYWPIYIIPRYGYGYEEVSPCIEQEAACAGLTNAVILLEKDPARRFMYSSGFVYNDPWLRSERIYARDLGKHKNECLHDSFPERDFHMFVPSSQWDRGTFVPLYRE